MPRSASTHTLTASRRVVRVACPSHDAPPRPGVPIPEGVTSRRAGDKGRGTWLPGRGSRRGTVPSGPSQRGGPGGAVGARGGLSPPRCRGAAAAAPLPEAPPRAHRGTEPQEGNNLGLNPLVKLGKPGEPGIPPAPVYKGCSPPVQPSSRGGGGPCPGR